MTPTTSERRRLALYSDAARFDVAAPAHLTARELLAAMGVAFDASRQALVLRSGREFDADSPVADLVDGTLLTVVDLAAPAARGRRAGATQDGARADHHAAWWLLTTIAALLAAAALGDLALETTLLGDNTRLPVAIALAVGATVAAALWSTRVSLAAGTGFALVAASSLAFASGIVAVPHVPGAAHLAVTCGLLSAVVLMGVLTVTASISDTQRAVRGAIGAALAIFLVLSAVWGGTLMMEWSTTTAAAITLGLVAPGIRWIPGLLLNLEDGYAINYEHFMSSKWSVRGAVPEDPGAVTMDVVKPHVVESLAKLTAGIVTLSALAVITAPIVAPGMYSASLLVRIGTIGVLVATVIALFLGPRRHSSATLRWVPRATATFVALVVVITFALHSSDAVRSVLAAAMMVAAILAAVLIVPVGKGASSLIWSRLGDTFEALAVALALPMGLLAANVVDSMRTVMAG